MPLFPGKERGRKTNLNLFASSNSTFVGCPSPSTFLPHGYCKPEPPSTPLSFYMKYNDDTYSGFDDDTIGLIDQKPPKNSDFEDDCDTSTNHLFSIVKGNKGGSGFTPENITGYKFNESDLALATVPGQEFDPRTRAFTDEELKPQPMIKKSRKQVSLCT